MKVGISNRHVHLTKEDLNILFGAELTKKNDLSQSGQFACNETVILKTEKREIPNVRIIGPIRNYTQVEISKTDAYSLGINPPVRESGDLVGSEIITIIGPIGQITKECCIIANRHIHINREVRKQLNLENKNVISIKINGIKSGIINNVYVKEQEDFLLELHLDTDDANAFLLKNGDEVEIYDN